MKTLLKLIGFLAFMALFCWLSYQFGQAQIVCEPMSIGESQQILHELGYYWGPIDYIWGPQTEQAYCDYKADQAMRGMPK